MDRPWWEPSDSGNIPTPALLVYPERVERNIRKMIQIAGDPGRLRPHVKTHKLAPLVQLQQKLGINKFKCATIAEAEMTAAAGASEVLLAYPMLGPNVPRVEKLIRTFPQTRFSVLVDSPEGLATVENHFRDSGLRLDVFLDVDCGMHRTGIPPGPAAAELYAGIAASSALRPAGLHVYDGHLHQSDPEERARACDETFRRVEEFRDVLARAGFEVPTLVAGGTPTFPIHAQHPDRECAPGTTVLWDFGYAEKFADLPFECAAVLMTRVVSAPLPGRFCLDLGHKAVASENPPPRVKFLNLEEAEAVGHSEEHLVIETRSPLRVGQILYGVPRHICPTVALHSEVWFISGDLPSKAVEVTARSRHLTI